MVSFHFCGLAKSGETRRAENCLLKIMRLIIFEKEKKIILTPPGGGMSGTSRPLSIAPAFPLPTSKPLLPHCKHFTPYLLVLESPPFIIAASFYKLLVFPPPASCLYLFISLATLTEAL